MTQPTSRPTRILAVMDQSESQIALRSAAALADSHGAVLEVFAGVEPPGDLNLLARLSGRAPEQLVATLVERRRAEAATRLRAIVPDRAIEPHVAVGKTFLEIVRHVAASGCDFVVKAAEPLSGIHRFLFASTDQHLLRKCPCPVWLQTANAPVVPRRVLAAVDLDVWDAAEPETLTALNHRVVDAALGIARAPDAQVLVLHAWDAVGEGMVWAFAGSGDEARMSADRYINETMDERRHAMTRFLASLREEGRNDVPLIPRLVRGPPAQVIEEAVRSESADVVVMGTVARTGLGGILIGNTAENIINSLECPVLAVKPEGFDSPLLKGP